MTAPPDSGEPPQEVRVSADVRYREGEGESGEATMAWVEAQRDGDEQ